MTLNISLPDDLRAALDEQVVRGHFASHSDYVAKLILQDQQRQAREQVEQDGCLESTLLARVESGEPAEMTRETWASLREELVRRITPGQAR